MRKSILSERRTDSPIRSAKILFLQLRKIIFALRRKNAKKHSQRAADRLTYPECKNFIFAIAKKHFSHSGEKMRKSILSERLTGSPIRSAKILFLQLRKIIFALRRKNAKKHSQRAADRLTYPECKNFIFAIAKNHFRTPEKFVRSQVNSIGACRRGECSFRQAQRADDRLNYPECKNFIFAIAKNHFRTPEKKCEKAFSPSGGQVHLSGVQKFHFCNCEKSFFALRRKNAKKHSQRAADRLTYPECKNFIFAIAKNHFRTPEKKCEKAFSPSS
ncbi:hypothetical protein [Desulfonema magnum]|nr:hypothetical protein [Desulfonema magnum]